MAELAPRRWVGVAAGLALTSASLSSGFIWACGTPCVSEPLLWTPARRVPLVFGAALLAWWGYLLAHHAAAGTPIDPGGSGAASAEADEPPVESALAHHAGVLGGVAILVLGMVIGVVYIRRGDHLATNVGGILFLGGYAVAHYVETGKPL